MRVPLWEAFKARLEGSSSPPPSCASQTHAAAAETSAAAAAAEMCEDASNGAGATTGETEREGGGDRQQERSEELGNHAPDAGCSVQIKCSVNSSNRSSNSSSGSNSTNSSSTNVDSTSSSSSSNGSSSNSNSNSSSSNNSSSSSNNSSSTSKSDRLRRGVQQPRSSNTLAPVRGMGVGSQARYRELMAQNRSARVRSQQAAAGWESISSAQLAQHNGRENAWVALDGVVYDISSYLSYHPGGEKILLQHAGTDVSALFRKYHPWVNAALILEFNRVGVLQREL